MPGRAQAAVLVLRWFLDATRAAPLAVDNQISGSTTDRCLLRALGPTAGADLWWSGKHHSGNTQVVTAPYGWPLWARTPA